MIDYTIKAIPTEYGGRRYRSRLEAKWAAFFDVLKVRFEYEPADLGRWSPDFLLPSTYPILVEVKPLSAFDQDVGLKMETAARAAQFDGDLLLLGTSPISLADGGIGLGWWSSTRVAAPWRPAITFMAGPARQIGNGYPADFTGRIVKLDGLVTAAWDAACTLVQWRPK